MDENLQDQQSEQTSQEVEEQVGQEAVAADGDQVVDGISESEVQPDDRAEGDTGPEQVNQDVEAEGAVPPGQATGDPASET